MTLEDTFRSEVEGYLAHADMDPTAFGKRALNDPNFVGQLRRGRSPSARTIDRVRRFIADNPATGARSAA